MIETTDEIIKLIETFLNTNVSKIQINNSFKNKCFVFYNSDIIEYTIYNNNKFKNNKILFSYYYLKFKRQSNI